MKVYYGKLILVSNAIDIAAVIKSLCRWPNSIMFYALELESVCNTNKLLETSIDYLIKYLSWNCVRDEGLYLGRFAKKSHNQTNYLTENFKYFVIQI